MPNASILLKDGWVVRIDTFNEVVYSWDGFIHSIAVSRDNVITKYTYTKKIAFHPDDYKIVSSGYYDEAAWLEYKAGKREVYQIQEFKISDFEHVKAGDTIIVKRVEVRPPSFDNIFLVTYNLICDADNKVLTKIIIPPDTAPAHEAFASLLPFATTFYNRHLHFATDIPNPEVGVIVATYLARIANTINELNKNIYPLFGSDPFFLSLMTQQNQYWISGTVFDQSSMGPIFPRFEDYDDNIFSRYYNNLRTLYVNLFNNSSVIPGLTTEEKIYLLGSVGTNINIFYTLGASVKLSILKRVANELSVVSEKSVPEQLCIKVTSSFDGTNVEEINKFLEGLIDDKYLMENSVTLYEFLYSRMSTSWDITQGFIGAINWVFKTDFKSTDTKGAFVHILYGLWQYSKYNPYFMDDGNFDGTIKPDTIGFKQLDPDVAAIQTTENTDSYLFKYTHQKAYEAVPYAEPELAGVFDYRIKWKEAAPIVIPYSSEKHIGIYWNNYNFEFDKEKHIVAYEALRVLDTYNYGLPITIHYDDDDGTTMAGIQYGKYEIFQPVTLANADPETRVPFYSIVGDDLSVNGLSINSFMPVFVLKYIDDAGDRSSAETIIGYGVDFVLTVSMIGNISKIRHLRWAAAGIDTTGLFTIQGMTIVLDTVTFSSEVLRFFLQFVECGENDNFCKTLKSISHILSITCLSINAGRLVGVGAKALKRQFYRLIELSGGGTTEAIIKLNLKISLQASYPSAAESTIDNAVDALYALCHTNGLNAQIFSEGLISELRKKLAARVLQENNSYLKSGGILSESPVGIESKSLPRFSKEKYIVSSTDKWAATNTGVPLHSDAEMLEMLTHGIDLKLPGEVVDGFILRSQRTLKQAEKSIVKDWMDKFDNYLKPVAEGGRGGVAYCFNNVSSYNSFKSSLKNQIIDKFRLSKYGDVQMTGSVLYKPSPADLDLSIYLFQDTMNELVNDMKAIANKAVTDGIWKRAKADSFITRLESYYTNNGRLSGKFIIAIENGKVKTLSRQLEKMHPVVEQLNLTEKKMSLNIYNISAEPTRSLAPEVKIIF